MSNLEDEMTPLILFSFYVVLNENATRQNIDTSSHISRLLASRTKFFAVIRAFMMENKFFVVCVLFIMLKLLHAQSNFPIFTQSRSILNQQTIEEDQMYRPTSRRVIYAPGYCIPPMQMDRLGHCRVVW